MNMILPLLLVLLTALAMAALEAVRYRVSWIYFFDCQQRVPENHLNA
jgi:hypothetical protein